MFKTMEVVTLLFQKTYIEKEFNLKRKESI